MQVVEEYALISAAIPAHVKYGGDYWEMTLRGGGERNVQVGNIFSGLFCVVQDKKGLDNPEVVRVPGRAKTYDPLPESEFLKKRRREMRKTLRELRPFRPESTAPDALILSGQNLFTWAEESSLEYQEQLQARVFCVYLLLLSFLRMHCADPMQMCRRTTVRPPSAAS